MRYLTIYTPAQRRLLVIDLSKPCREALIDGLYYTDKLTALGMSAITNTPSKPNTGEHRRGRFITEKYLPALINLPSWSDSQP